VNRKIPMVARMMREESLRAFRAWTEKQDKTPY
jgi:hypothetical protein